MVFALDDSGSIANNDFWHMISETRDLLSTAFTHEDRISIFTFDQLVRRRGTSFMPHLEAMAALPTPPARIAGWTALNQAIHLSNLEFELPQARDNAARIMIVITDGINNQPGPTPSALVQHANFLNVTIFTIGIGNVNVGVLLQLAYQTGGQFFHISDFAQLSYIFDQIRYGIRPGPTHGQLPMSYYELTQIFEFYGQRYYVIDVEMELYMQENERYDYQDRY